MGRHVELQAFHPCHPLPGAGGRPEPLVLERPPGALLHGEDAAAACDASHHGGPRLGTRFGVQNQWVALWVALWEVDPYGNPYGNHALSSWSFVEVVAVKFSTNEWWLP